jgi:hypothetical protein
VEVQTADGGWIAAEAVSEVEPTHVDGRKVHDFPVIWVRFEGGGWMPWPVESVREVKP